MQTGRTLLDFEQTCHLASKGTRRGLVLLPALPLASDGRREEKEHLKSPLGAAVVQQLLLPCSNPNVDVRRERKY